MALTKLITDLIDGDLGGGTTWVSDPKTANFTAVAGEGYFINTTSTAITVTLPSSPTAGDEVSIIDYGANASTNNITITSSDNIEGASDDLVLSTDKVSKTLVYSDATKGWLVTTDAGAGAAAADQAITVDFLVVAAGGTGGLPVSTSNYGGGGGAGGLRTSYGSISGGGASAESSLDLLTNQDYIVSVGAGAAGHTADNRGNSGGDSRFHTIISIGGGGGGSQMNQGTQAGKTGGSGGGGGYHDTTQGGGSGTLGQGYDGGDGGANVNRSGGGGGAGEVGGTGTTNDGGDGLAVNILNATNAASESVGEVSGSDVYYAGGGAGTIQVNYSTASGGLGGGGDGSVYNGTSQTPGTANTGGGGAGGGVNKAGQTGGSGVVIIRYSSSFLLLENTIGGNVLTFNTYTEGSDKVSVFTAGENGTIQFTAV